MRIGRAHAARLRARRVLGACTRWAASRRSSARCRWRRMAWSWIHRRRPLAHPLDDGTAVLLARSLDAHARESIGGPTAAPTAGCMAPFVDGAPTAARRCSLAPCRPAPAPARAGPLRAACDPVRARAGPARFSRPARPRALRRDAAAHSILPPRPAAHRRRSASCSPRSATHVGWPVAARRLAGHRRRPGLATCARWAARSGPDRVGSSLDDLPPPRRAPRRDPAAARSPSRATGCPPLPPGSRRYRYGPGVVQDRPGARRADPVDRRGAAGGRGTVHLGRHARGDRRSGGRGGGGASTPSARSCSSPSRACSTPTRAPAGKHTAWAYCHVPNGSTRRHDRADRGPDRALRARLPRAHPRPPRHAPADVERAQPQLRRRRHQRRRRRPAAALHPAGAAARSLRHARPAALHLLVLHAAGRRRARHVRATAPRGRPCAGRSERPGAARRPPQVQNAVVQMLST